MWLFNTIRDWSSGSLCEKLNIFFKIKNKKKKSFIMVNDRLKKNYLSGHEPVKAQFYLINSVCVCKSC